MAGLPSPVEPLRDRRDRRPRDEDRTVLSRTDRRRPGVLLGFGASKAVVLIALVVSGAGPLLWLFKAATSTTQETVTEPFALWPSGIHWEQLGESWRLTGIGGYLWNTLVVIAGTWVATLIVCVGAAYVLSVVRPWWGKYLSGAIVVTLFLPSIISLVPLYLAVVRVPVLDISLLNTYWAVWLAHAPSAFYVLVLKRYFDTLPADLFDAARIDGLGEIGLLFRIVLPLSKPVIGVISLLAIVAAWKDFLWPLLALPDERLQPVSVILPKIQSEFELSVQMGALFLTLFIPVILFLVFQRQFLRGAGAAGGIKG